MKAVLLVLLFFTFSAVYGQSNRQPVYRAQVTTHNGLQLVGVLTHLGDSSLQLVPLAQFRKGQLIGEPELHTYSINDIYMLRIRKKGAPERTALISGILGFAVGALIGGLTYNDPCSSSTGSWGCIQILDEKDTIIMAGALGAVTGAGIGTLAGSTYKRYYVRGDYEIYRQMRSELSQFVYHLPLTAQSR